MNALFNVDFEEYAPLIALTSIWNDKLLLTIHENKRVLICEVDSKFEIAAKSYCSAKLEQLATSADDRLLALSSSWKEPIVVDSLPRFFKASCVSSKTQAATDFASAHALEKKGGFLNVPVKSVPENFMNGLSDFKTRSVRNSEKPRLKNSFGLQSTIEFSFVGNASRKSQPVEDLIKLNYINRPDRLVEDIERLSDSNVHLKLALRSLLYEQIDDFLDSVLPDEDNSASLANIKFENMPEHNVTKENYKKIYQNIKNQHIC